MLITILFLEICNAQIRVSGARLFEVLRQIMENIWSVILSPKPLPGNNKPPISRGFCLQVTVTSHHSISAFSLRLTVVTGCPTCKIIIRYPCYRATIMAVLGITVAWNINKAMRTNVMLMATNRRTRHRYSNCKLLLPCYASFIICCYLIYCAYGTASR